MEANGYRDGRADELEVEGDFTKKEVDEFLKKTSIERLSEVHVVYFICNPTKPEMPRRISLRSKESRLGWDPINYEGSYFCKFLKDNAAQEKEVQVYYQANKEQFKDVHTWDGQMRLEEATGVHGGSFVFSPCGSKELIKYRLAKVFLALANGLNDGQFVEDATFVLSLKMFPNIRNNRVKLDMYSSTPLTKIGTNIRRVIEENDCGYFQIRSKSHVASYLSQLSEVQRLKSKFENSLQTTTELIDEVAQLLEKAQLEACF